MAKNRILISIPVIFIVLIAALIMKHEKEMEDISPCCLGGPNEIKIIYILSKHPRKNGKSAGCSLCDSNNQDQWKTLYRFYGGRDDIEFIVLFPDEITKHNSPNIPYDIGLILKKWPMRTEDGFIICKRTEKMVEQSGRIDMNFIRKANAILSRVNLKKDI